MGGSQSLSNFSEGGVAPTDPPATTPTAQGRGHRSFQSPPTGRGHPPSLISTHKASKIVTTLTLRCAETTWYDPTRERGGQSSPPRSLARRQGSLSLFGPYARPRNPPLEITPRSFWRATFALPCPGSTGISPGRRLLRTPEMQEEATASAHKGLQTLLPLSPIGH